MARKRKQITGVPEAELSFMQQLGKEEDTRRKRDGTLTRSERVRAQSHVERFIAAGGVAGFPVVDADVQAEQSLVYTGVEPIGVLVPLIEAALALGSRPPALGAQMIATLLFGSYDDTHGCDVRCLRAGQLSVDRVLAHVTALPVKLEARVAFAVARRATQVLLNAAPAAGRTLQPPAEAAAAAPEPELPADRPSAEPALEEELCVECGATYPAGTAHRCEPADPPSAYFPDMSRTLDVTAREQLAAHPVEALAGLVPPPVLVPPLLHAAAVELGALPAVSAAEAAEFAAAMAQKMAEPDEQRPAPAPPEPAKASPAPARDRFWDGPDILVLDFTGRREPPTARPVERAARDRVARQVIGWARTRVALTFFCEEGIGKDGHFEQLPAGALVEVLKPDERDQHDKEYRKAIDQKEKREPRQLVVIRWQGGVSLVWGSEVEAVTEDVYKGSNQQEVRP